MLHGDLSKQKTMIQASTVSLFILLVILVMFIGLALLPVEIVVEEAVLEDETVAE